MSSYNLHYVKIIAVYMYWSAVRRWDKERPIPWQRAASLNPWHWSPPWLLTAAAVWAVEWKAADSALERFPFRRCEYAGDAKRRRWKHAGDAGRKYPGEQSFYSALCIRSTFLWNSPNINLGWKRNIDRKGILFEKAVSLFLMSKCQCVY